MWYLCVHIPSAFFLTTHSWVRFPQSSTERCPSCLRTENHILSPVLTNFPSSEKKMLPQRNIKIAMYNMRTRTEVGRAESTQTNRTPLYKMYVENESLTWAISQHPKAALSVHEAPGLWRKILLSLTYYLREATTGQKEEKSSKETFVPAYRSIHPITKDPYKLYHVNTEEGVNRTSHTLSLLVALLLNFIKLWMWLPGSTKDCAKNK